MSDFAAGAAPARHHTAFVIGTGGVRLHTQAWIPRSPLSAVVVVHGLGEHSGRYAEVAEALVADGHSVYTLDHRGHGRSAGRRALVGSFDAYTADLDLVVREAMAETPDRPLFLIGHSMGGLIGLCYMLDHPDRFAAAVVSGTPASVPHHISPTTVRLGRLLGRLVPPLPLTQLPLDKVSRDPEVVRRYFTDPLITHGRLRAGTGAAMLAAMEKVDSGAPTLFTPILILHGGADAITDVGSSERLLERVGSVDKRLIIYPDLYHEIYNEPERVQVIDDVRTFLRAQRNDAAPPVRP